MANIDFFVKNGLQVRSNVVVGSYVDNVTAPVDGLVVSGAVGIGTSSPLGKLTVSNGNIYVNTLGFGIVYPDGSFQNTADITMPAGTTGALQYKTSTGTFGGNVNLLYVDSETGFVGVGTSIPTSKITIENGDLELITLGNGIYFPDGSFQTSAAATTPSAGLEGAVQFANSTGGFDGDVTKLYLDTVTWNVGIGTSLPDEKAVVNGGNLKVSTLGYGLIFPDGSFQTTASAGSSATGGTGAIQYSSNSNTFIGDANVFYFDSSSYRVGVGTNDVSTSGLHVVTDAPTLLDTRNSGEAQLIIGNSATTGVTLGQSNSGLFGYLRQSNAGTNIISWTDTGVGIKNVTAPINALDIAGGVVIGGGIAYAGTATAPSNGMLVQGTVGVGTSSSTGIPSGNIVAAFSGIYSSVGFYTPGFISAGTGLRVNANGINVTGASTFSGNVTIGGNLILQGNTIISGANILVVDDPIIYIGESNPADVWDLGVVGSYNSGTYYHTGLLRNHNDGVWTIFDKYTSEPETTINWGAAGLTFGSFKSGNINVAASTVSTSTSTGALIVAGGSGIAGNLNVGGTVSFTNALAATSGGTGQSSYAVGDLLYASSTTALSKLADVATGSALISGGVGVAPSWGKIGLTTHVSGTLPVANGGTGLTGGTSGGVLYYSAAGTLASSVALAANSLVVGGGAGIAPSTITTGTGVVTALGVNTGSAGAFVVNSGALGTPSSGTLTSCTGLPLTTGVTGTLPVGNGGTGATTFTTNGLLYGNGTSAVQVTAQGGANTILVANAGAPSFSATPTIGTSVTVPLVIGGTTASSSLTLQSTSGAGTTDSIIFKVGNSGAVQAMTINTSGLVGIGTTSPTSRLTVYGSTEATQQITVDGTSNTSSIKLRYNGSDVGFLQTYQNGELNIGTSVPSFVNFYTNNVERMRITNAGSIGVGTTNPGYKLDVFGAINASSAGFYSNGIQLLASDGVSNYLKTGAKLFIQSGSTSLAIIDSAGNVGIGTISASSKLDVWNGNIDIQTTGFGLIFPDSTFQTTAFSSTSAVTSFSAGTTGLTPSTATTGAVTLAGTLNAANGGTGQSSYAIGDLLYASASNALSKLADVATGSALISGGVGVAPSYGKIGLTTHVSGTLPVANGGTGLTGGTSGGVLYYSAAGTLASSAALAASALVVGGGAGVAPSTITTGTGVVSALGVNTGTAGAFVVNGGALGTPSSGTLTNCTFPTLNQNTTGYAAGIAGGSLGQILYQTGANATGFVGVGTSGWVLTGAGSALPQWTQATNANTASTIVQRDASGNFSAGTITAATGLSVSAGGASITGNLSVTGNILISGNIFSVNSNVLVVDDPIIYIGDSNPADAWDMGIVASYTSGTYKHTGFARDNSNNTWTIFDNLITEPTETINWAQAGLTFGNFKVGNVAVASGLASSTSTTGALVVTGGVGVSGDVNIGGNYTGTWNGNTISVAKGGTGLTSGTSGGVLYYSAAGTLASSGALTASALVVGGGAGGAPSTITTGTGVVSALGVNTGTAGAFVVNGGALGTPSSGTLTNCTFPTLNQNTTGYAAGIAGGSLGQLHYQTGVNTTGFVGVGTSGWVLTGAGAALPQWTQATNANTASTIVQRDASGNFSAGTITASLSGNATSATTATNIAGGTAGALAYQTGAGATSFISAGASGTILTGTGGTPAYSASPTISTSITTPIHYGGTTASSTLTLQSTSGAGTSDSIVFKVGNNGATTAMNINTNGRVGVGTSTMTHRFEVWGGNIDIGQTGFGLVFPDNTFQTTAFSSSAVVSSFSAGTTGLTPSTGTTGAVTLAGTLNLSSGGTNASLTASNGGIIYSTATAMAVLGASSTSGNVLISGGAGAPTWGQSYTSSNVANSIVSRDANGNIAVGNTSIAGSLTVNGSSGTAGQVLQSTGSTVQWKSFVTSSSTAPVSPLVGDMWYDTDIGVLFLYYYDGSSYQWVEASPQILSEGPTGTYTLSGELIVTGNTTIQGTLYETSDVTLKTDISTIDNALNVVDQLRGVNFTWKKNNNQSMGVIAQEIESVLPQLVNTDISGIKSVNYTAMIGLLVEAIKELSKKVDNNGN